MGDKVIKFVYKIEKSFMIKIFDKQFVDENKPKCKILYNNKKYTLREYFPVYLTKKTL